MLRKPRFVHHQTFNQNTPYRGFTVLLDRANDEDVYIKTVLCSKADQFCRATGRAAALEKQEHLVSVAKLPEYLANLEAKVEGYKIHDDPRTRRYYANQWAWIWKYFL